MSHLVYFSLYLYKLGIAPQIQDLLGKVNFTGNSCGGRLVSIACREVQKKPCSYDELAFIGTPKCAPTSSIMNFLWEQFLKKKILFWVHNSLRICSLI